MRALRHPPAARGAYPEVALTLRARCVRKQCTCGGLVGDEPVDDASLEGSVQCGNLGGAVRDADAKLVGPGGRRDAGGARVGTLVEDPSIGVECPTEVLPDLSL